MTPVFDDVMDCELTVAHTARAVHPMTINASMNSRLHIQVVGNGEPALVFVHGFACTHEDWRKQIPALSPTFRCVALDLPGHGMSAPPAQATMTALGDAVNVAKAKAHARRVVLVGHSLGCKVIREAYSASNADVAGLVFIEGAYYDGDREALMERARDLIDSEGFATFAKRHFAAMFVEGTDPTLRDQVLARVAALDPQFARDMYIEAVGWDPLRGEQTLREIGVPVLVLQSTYNDARLVRKPLDSGMTTPFMDAVERLVDRADITVVPGCGHFCLLEAPDVVNRELHAFASKLTRTAAST